MIPKIIFGFMLLLCERPSVSRAHEYTVVPQEQDGVYIPIQSDLIVPSQDEHHIGSIYVPTYHQETTYTFPEYEPNTDVVEGEDDKATSLIVTILEFLYIPKKIAIIMTSGIFWTYKNIVMLVVGMVATIALCSYGNLCTISWQSPIIEFRSTVDHFRSMATPARLDAATSFVKEAIKKYRNLQSNEVTTKKS